MREIDKQILDLLELDKVGYSIYTTDNMRPELLTKMKTITIRRS